MLKYFRINDPYRLVVLFLVLLALRLPVMISGNMITFPDLNYLLIGEKLSSGFRLYDGLWANIGPLSAMVYSVSDFLFGRSLLAMQIISLFFIFFQSYFFNKIMLVNKAYNESTYLPGVTYGILLSFFFDEFTLSPAIMGLTFVLITINGVLRHIEIKSKKDEQVLYIGVHLGVAILFYLPYIIFLPFVLLTFVFFTGTILRRYFLFLYGFILPPMLAGIYLMLTGRLKESLFQFVYPLFTYPGKHYLHWVEIIIIFSPPLLFTVLGMLSLLQRARLTVFQTNLSRFMWLWVMFGAVYLLICKTIVPAYLVLFVPPMAFYISHYFMLVRKKWMAELLFTLFFISPVFFNIGTLYAFFPTSEWVDTSRYFVEEGENEELVKNKNVLVLGDDMSPYLHARLATPFLDFPLARPLFEEWQYYDNLTVITEGFVGDLPDVIIDQQGLMHTILPGVPILARKYEEVKKGIFVRKNN